jgi:hypothetical protein
LEKKPNELAPPSSNFAALSMITSAFVGEIVPPISCAMRVAVNMDSVCKITPNRQNTHGLGIETHKSWMKIAQTLGDSIFLSILADRYLTIQT